MYFSPLVAFVTLFLDVPSLAQESTTLAYDNAYDGGSLPSFPFVGGAPTVQQWDDPNCGKCYTITYGTSTINVLEVDVSKNGFTVSQQAMDNLTNYSAQALGRVPITYIEADASACHL
ncbi:hypothetical protein ID866_12813 [Astraeus odoratus]|nr:hypothetical protein ID866_12813 [Astraeus odoratus]